MNQAKQVIAYLDALGRELAAQRVASKFHILVTGGAWMLLQQQRRTTHDIDFALVIPPGKPKVNQVVSLTIQRGGEIATRSSNTVFSQAVEAVAEIEGLTEDWLNDESAEYLYDSAPGADAYLWRVFSDLLYVYLPTAEYMFTLKLIANRRKDKADIRVIVAQLGISTVAEGQAIMDRFLTQDEQHFWEVAKRLKNLFH